MSQTQINQELSKLRIDRKRKQPRRSRWWLWVLLIGVAAGLGFAWHVKVGAAVPVQVVSARVVEAGEGGPAAIPAGQAVLTASGYVIPRHVVEVSSKIVGRIVEMNVSRGDRVKAGDVLIRLDDIEQRAQLQMAQASLASSQARLDEMKAGSRPQEIAASKAALASAKATLQNAESELNRQKDLADKKVAARAELDNAQAAFSVAQAQVDAAEENLKLLQTWPRREQLMAQEAQVAHDKANVEYSQNQLNETILRAPIDGTILEKVAEKGELVTNMNFGGTRGAKSSVVSMADLKDLQIELDVNEGDMPKIHLNQNCEITVDSAPNKTFKGSVDEIAPQADRQKGTVQTKVRLIDPTDDVLPEVNARVTFLSDAPPAQPAQPEAPEKPRVIIPKQALLDGAQGKMVYIAADGVAVARAVKTGVETNAGIEVTDGLAGNEQLIVSPLDKISNGTAISVAGAAIGSGSETTAS